MATKSVPAGTVVWRDKLPYQGRHPVDLGPLRLVPGDRVKLTLEASDYRGELPGESYFAEPLVLEIADEATVMAAIGEADEESDKQLNELIQQQLRIGESR